MIRSILFYIQSLEVQLDDLGSHQISQMLYIVTAIVIGKDCVPQRNMFKSECDLIWKIVYLQRSSR